MINQSSAATRGAFCFRRIASRNDTEQAAARTETALTEMRVAATGVIAEVVRDLQITTLQFSE